MYTSPVTYNCQQPHCTLQGYHEASNTNTVLRAPNLPLSFKYVSTTSSITHLRRTLLSACFRQVLHDLSLSNLSVSWQYLRYHHHFTIAPKHTASRIPAYSPHLLNPVIHSLISTRPALFPNSTDVPLLWRAYCNAKPSRLSVDSRELPIPRNTRPGSFSITSKLCTTSQAAIAQHPTETCHE
jgi:hypothetical protein